LIKKIAPSIADKWHFPCFVARDTWNRICNQLGCTWRCVEHFWQLPAVTR